MWPLYVPAYQVRLTLFPASESGPPKLRPAAQPWVLSRDAMAGRCNPCGCLQGAPACFCSPQLTACPGVSGACKHSAARSALPKHARHTLQAQRRVLRPAAFKVWRELTQRALLWRRAYRAELCHAMARTQRLAVHEDLVRVVAVRSAVRTIFAQVGCPADTSRWACDGSVGGLLVHALAWVTCWAARMHLCVVALLLQASLLRSAG